MIIVLRDLVMIMFMLIMLLITVTIFPRICSFSWSRSHLPLNVVKLGVLLLNLASHAHCHVGQVAQDAGDDEDVHQDHDEDVHQDDDEGVDQGDDEGVDQDDDDAGDNDIDDGDIDCHVERKK